MAGVVPKKTSGRKQWALHGGNKESLRRLRDQLASDGCPESQLVRAKQLLEEECEFESDRKKNAQQGVYWLIKASEQGNIEATSLLKKCLETGEGITNHNYMDVHSCISVTQDEKLAKKAAREMFASLSKGSEYITSEQLQRKILAIDRRETCSKSTGTGDISDQNVGNGGELVNNVSESDTDDDESDSSQKSDTFEKLTEDHLVAAAVNYSRGQLPIVNRILCLCDPNLNALDHIPFIHRPIIHPVLALKILYYKLMKFLGEKALPMFFPLAKSELQLLVLMFVYAFVSSDNVVYFLPILTYYATFIIMVCTTFKMLQNQREFVDFRLWSGLFICYSGGSLNGQESENLYLKNNLRPYGHFFLALLVNLMVYPIISEQWIPQSELAILAFLCTFTTLLGFMPKTRSKTNFDGLMLLSFALNVLAKYPYETDPVVAQGWRFLELNVPTFPSYVIGNGIEFCINFKFILYAFIPVLLTKLASRKNWRGTCEALIPHCVTLSWLQVCIISAQGATMFGILRGTLALVGIVMFLPLLGITSVLLPVIAVTKWIITSNFIYTAILFVTLTVLAFGVCYICAQTRYKKYIAILQIVLMLFAFMALISQTSHDLNENYYSKGGERHPQVLSWEVFQRFCYQPAWQDENVAVSQIKCAELSGTKVHWDGYINEIKIRYIKNIPKSIIDRFPGKISDYLYCLYGETVEAKCDNIPELVREDCLHFYETVKSIKQCTLIQHNKYTFEIVLKMQLGIWGKTMEVNVIASDYFKEFILKLKPTDSIWFRGSLYNNEMIGSEGILGGSKPHVDLEEIGCISCQDSSLTELKAVPNPLILKSLIEIIGVGFKFVFNVLFNPVIIFK